MDSRDYQAGRSGNLSPPNGDWSDFQRGAGEQQLWQANNDAVRRGGSVTEGGFNNSAGFIGSLLMSLIKLALLAAILYTVFF